MKAWRGAGIAAAALASALIERLLEPRFVAHLLGEVWVLSLQGRHRCELLVELRYELALAA